MEFTARGLDEALSESGRFVVVSAGRIEPIGAPQEIYDQPAWPLVADATAAINPVLVTIDGKGRGTRRNSLDVMPENPRSGSGAGMRRSAP